MIQDRLRDRSHARWHVRVFAVVTLLGFSLSAAVAHAAAAAAATPRATAAKAKHAAKRAAGGRYYIEFRSRYSWDDGHTYLIHARVGERLTAANVAGLSPAGDGETLWVLGHFIPVPSTTGATDGDLEEKEVSARYRVYMNKAEYDRVVAHIKKLQAHSKMWSLQLNNCNAFVADVAGFMGLKVPKSSWIYPRVFINNLRKINTHPDAEDTLFSDNVREMSNPTRDGRAMIANGIYKLQKDGTYAVDPNRVKREAKREKREPTPTVTIGAIRSDR